MINCSKCNNIPDENDVIGWKCNSCGKAFKVSKSKLRNILAKKAENPEKPYIHCPVCKSSLDDGNESIVWKCSCGNTNMGKLKDFEEEVKDIPKINLIMCPECGKKILSDSRICSYCGYLLEDTEEEKNLIKCPECGKAVSNKVTVCPHCGYEIIAQSELTVENKKEVPIYNNKKYISMLMCMIGCILLIVSITRITNDDYKFYKQHYQDCMDGYNDTKSTADSYLGGYFKSSYNSIASLYKDMADDDNKEIWKFRIQAIVLIGSGLALITCGFKNYKKEKNGNAIKKCPGYGYGIKEHFDKIERKIRKQKNIEIKEDPELPIVNKDESGNRQEPLQDVSNKKMLYGVCAVLAIIFIIVIIADTASENAKKCTFGSCDNYKMEGGEYCKEHTCKESGCTSSKSKYDSYCYIHEKEHMCEYPGCEKYRVDSGEYCFEHTCAKSGCYNKKGYGSDYCTEHQVDMRKRLTDSSFYFSLNSAGGIKFSFSAKNSTGKEIKYVRFDVELRNAVGDLVEDEIKNTTSVSVEIVGPVKSGSKVNMSNEIIGYCDTCARIDIDDITIIYTDGTSETGHFGYYYEK